MKKILSLAIAFMLVFSLVGCGSSTEEEATTAPQELKPEEGAELVVWESPGPEGDFMKMVGEAFEEKYGVKVTYEEVNHTDARAKLEKDGPAGVGADVFAAPHDHLGALVASGLVYPNSIDKDRVNNDFLSAATIGVTAADGVVYGYPTGIETYALFYNKDIFAQAPKTYEEIIEFGKTFNEPANNKYAFLMDVGNAYFSHSFVAGPGGYIFGNNGTDAADLGLNNEGAVTGMKNFLALKEIIPMQAGDANYDTMNGLFAEGNVGAIINGPWAVAGAQESGVNFGIAPLPLLDDGSHPQSFSGIRSLFVSSYTKYPMAAQLFAQMATSDEMLVKRFELTQQIPPVKALLDEPTIADNEVVAPFLEQAQYAVPMPSIPEMGTVWDPYGAAFAASWNGDQTAKEALDQAVQTIEETIANQEQ